MIFTEVILEVIGKPNPNDWKLDDGTTGTTCKLNVAQNDGVDVATIKCPQDVFDAVRRGDVCRFACSFAEYKNRSEFKISNLIKIENFKPSGATGSAPTPPTGGGVK